MNKKKNNVVIFFTDQQRWDTLGVHHNPMKITPNLDRAAHEGTHCYNAFTPQPVCLPARACLQSGLYASQTGCNSNNDGLDFGRFPGLASHFNHAGYHTGYIGKWHLSQNGTKAFSEPQGGYQYWMAENIPEFTSDAYEAVLHDGKGKEHRLPGYRADAYTDVAIRYIDHHQKKPFFLMISYLEPHFQNTRDDYPAPYGYEDSYQGCWFPPDLATLGGTSARHLPGYYGMVKRLDEAYGRLLDALRSLNILDNTIVLFSADHGCHFRTRKGEYKRTCHEASMRIPMVLSGGPFRSGGCIQELVSLVDMPPTLLDACNIEIPANYAGNSIVPLTQGRREQWPAFVYAETSEHQIGRVIRSSRWKYSVIWDEQKQAWCDEHLYDLKADPYELNCLIGYRSHKGVTGVLRQKLALKMVDIGQTSPQFIDAPEHNSGQQILKESEWYL